jgi:hypothetical protein
MNRATAADAGPLEVIEEDLRWKFRRQGNLVLAYNRGYQKRGDFYKSKPDWYPVLTPSGREVTISSAYRYNHHHSIWIGHGNVNGINVFHDNNPTRSNLGDIVVEQAATRPVPGGATLESTNGWIATDGRRLLTEQRRFTVRPDQCAGQAHVLDIDSEIVASEGPLVLAKETHSYLGVRVADSMDVEDGGRAVNSNGDENEEGAMGKVARWLDYSGPVAGQQAGVTIMHHPANPETPFFCRNYGTMLSNLTLHAPWSIAAGERLRQRWRLLIHDGDAISFTPEAAYRAWLTELEG